MLTVGKVVKVEMQGNNHISFDSDLGVCGARLEFGKIHESDDDEEEEDVPPIYTEEFLMNMFSFLMKLPGLCTQMQFFSPTVKRYPLKVSMLAGSLGKINVYIKDRHQIAYEETQTQQNS